LTTARARRCHSTVGGRLVEHGTHRELLEHGGLYATLYEQQFRDHATRRPTGAPTLAI
jgi:ABC-type multidrug transport system fused ATPase/permease subunit